MIYILFFYDFNFIYALLLIVINNNTLLFILQYLPTFVVNSNVTSVVNFSLIVTIFCTNIWTTQLIRKISTELLASNKNS